VTLARVHAVPALATMVVWAGTGVVLGGHALVVLAFLSLLEVTFSFDNAVVNAKLVTRLSPLWQRLFLTVGLLVAVGVVRFALPVVIVAATTGLGLGTVLGLLVHDPAAYGRHLAHATPMIEAFGGTFLIMIALGFFLDEAKRHHWLTAIERRLAPLGRHGNLDVLIMLVCAVVMFFTVEHGPAVRGAVFTAAVCGVILHVALGMTGDPDDPDDREDGHGDGSGGRGGYLVGAAAAAVFARLEVLDASFSFDGIVGAFAITTEVTLIGLGLGVGALWVRSLTVQLVRSGTLARFRYLEHGAHWALFALGTIMIIKLSGWHPAEPVVGSLGAALVGAAVVSSVVEQRRSTAPSG